jgi:hypothetical protein
MSETDTSRRRERESGDPQPKALLDHYMFLPREPSTESSCQAAWGATIRAPAAPSITAQCRHAICSVNEKQRKLRNLRCVRSSDGVKLASAPA